MTETRSNFVLGNAINAYEHTADSAFDRCTLDFLKELREYRKLEEQGLLLKLPCKVGDKAYVLFEEAKKIKEYKVSGYKFYDDEDGICMLLNQCLEISVDYLGKDLFLTKEEAEQKLNELN